MSHQARYSHTSKAAAVLAVAFVVTVMITSAANSNPGIAPPNSHAFGASYAEWGARWWQWIFSIPAQSPDGLPNPLFTDGAVDCGFAQSNHAGSDHVWFLAGRFCLNPNCGVVTTAHRSCNVPTGTALFFPILNSETDNVGTVPALPLDQLVGLAASLSDAAQLHARINGVALGNLFAYRAPYAPFTFTLPFSNNLYQFLGADVPGRDWPSTVVMPAASDGYFVMVEPLPPGRYTINFGGTAKNSAFQLDITYDISVGPRGRF